MSNRSLRPILFLGLGLCFSAGLQINAWAEPNCVAAGGVNVQTGAMIKAIYDATRLNYYYTLKPVVDYTAWAGVSSGNAQYYCYDALGRAYNLYYIMKANYDSVYVNTNFCTIYNAECPNNPTYAGTIWDSYDGSRSSQERCLKRAEEYRVWCGSSKDVTANWLNSSYAVIATTTARGSSTTTVSTSPSPSASASTGSSTSGGSTASPSPSPSRSGASGGGESSFATLVMIIQ